MAPQNLVDDVSGNRRWRTAFLIMLAVLIAYWLVNMVGFRMAASWPHFAIQGDQHQSIGHFWRYNVEGTIQPGHLLSDYAWTYHAPTFFWFLMSTMSAIFDPLLASKILGYVAYVGFALMVVLIVGRRTEWILGAFVGLLIMRNPPDNPDQLTGGLARGFSATLFYLFLYAFMQRNHPLVLLTLVLQAGTYPAISIACTITYGFYCLLAGPDMRTRLRRCAGMTVAGIFILVLGGTASSRTPEWWGGSVTFEQAQKMPAWGPGGRFPEVPHRDFQNAIEHNLTRQYKDNGAKVVPNDAVRWVSRHQVATFVGIPLGIAAFAYALSLVLRRARRRADVDVQRPPEVFDNTRRAAEAARKKAFPWEIVALIAGALVSYTLVRVVAFKLFLPSRQIGFTIPFVMVVGTPMIVWWTFTRLLPRRRALVVAITVLITVVPAFLFRGHGFAHTRAGYRHHKSDEKIYNALRTKVPKDEEVACDLMYCEFVMPLGQRVPYAARNLTHPLRPGFYNEAERRLVKMHEVLYATSPKTIHDFVETEKVRYFVYRKGKVGKLETYTYKPIDKKFREIFKKGQGKPRLLEDPPKETIVFRDGDRYLLDLSKWPKDAKEAGSDAGEADAADKAKIVEPLNPKGNPRLLTPRMQAPLIRAQPRPSSPDAGPKRQTQARPDEEQD